MLSQVAVKHGSMLRMSGPRILAYAIAGMLAAWLSPSAADASRELKPCGQLESGLSKLTITVLGADVAVRQEDRSNISVVSNYPDNWHVSEQGTIEQETVHKCPAGIFKTANGNLVVKGNDTVVMGKHFTIDGKTMSTDDPGPVDPKEQDEPEVLQVFVPNNCQANLEVVNTSSTYFIHIDSWSGQQIRFSGISMGSDVSIGTIKNSEEFGIRVDGRQSILIEAIDTPLFKAVVNRGDVRIRDLTAGHADIYCSGAGELEVSSGTVKSCVIWPSVAKVQVPSSFSNVTRRNTPPQN